jgi:Protein of unknown function (DUF2829)
MKTFIGTKVIDAKPMTRQEYNDYRGWELPGDEDGSDAGYLVEYTDGGTLNHPDHKGYISWSPKEQFDNAYRPVSGMTFGLAIEAAKKGLKIARGGWNGKNMFVAYMLPLYLPPHNNQEAGPKVNERTAKHIGEDTPLDSQAYFAMFNAQGKWQPGWLASQSDMLADDWEIVK